MLPSSIDVLIRAVAKGIGLDSKKLQSQIDDAFEMAKKAGQSMISIEEHYRNIDARLARLESAIQIVDEQECNTVTPIPVLTEGE